MLLGPDTQSIEVTGCLPPRLTQLGPKEGQAKQGSGGGEARAEGWKKPMEPLRGLLSVPQSTPTLLTFVG